MADIKDKIKEQRMDEYTRIREELLAEGYTEHNAVISIVKANVMAILTALPFAVLFVVLFVILAPYESGSWSNSILKNELILLAAIVVSIPVHELLHGAGWLCFCKNGRKSINFGVIWKNLTPYCHCSETLKISQYYVGLVIPFFVLGVIPCVISVINGSILLLLFGIFGIVGAGGDTTIGCLIFRYIGKNALLLDHPSECGCAVFVKGE